MRIAAAVAGIAGGAPTGPDTLAHEDVRPIEGHEDLVEALNARDADRAGRRRVPVLAPLVCLLLAACGAPELTRDPARSDTSQSGGSRSLVGVQGADDPLAEGVVLGRTTDEHGQAHTLVLHADGIREAVRPNTPFVVLSGTTTFSVTGEAVVGPWRFVVDSSATGDAAPVVVLKYQSARSVVDLVADPTSFTGAAAFNEDVPGIFARLSALVARTIAKAKAPDGDVYDALADMLLDPAWTGVLVFNAAVPAVPADVLGRPTGELAGAPVVAHDLGFTTSPASWRSPDDLFATIDHPAAGSDAAAPGVPRLRARFAHSGLVSFQRGGD